jgi:hypothetical protein
MRSVLVFEEEAGRIYCRAGEGSTTPAWMFTDYVQWNTQRRKYGLYFFVGKARDGHDRVGATPSFEQALDWLLQAARP